MVSKTTNAVLLLAVLLLLLLCSPSIAGRQSQHSLDDARTSVNTCPNCTRILNGAAQCRNGICRLSCRAGYILANRTCIKGCPPGQQLNAAGACSLCPQGTFKSSRGPARCAKCPTGKSTVGALASDRDSSRDCLPGGLLKKGPGVGGTGLVAALALFEENLNFARTFTGKGGGRRNGCMLNCEPDDSAAGTVEAFLAGAPLAYRADEPWMGMTGRLPKVKAQAVCASVVGSSMSSVLEASLASLYGAAAGSSFSPTFAYFCAQPGGRTCTAGWSNDAAAHAVASAPAAFFTSASCAGVGTFNAASCSTTAERCGTSPVSRCTVEALDLFHTIQRKIRSNGAVLSSLIVDGGFKSFFDGTPEGVFNATVDPNNPATLRISVTLVGYDNINFFWWVLLPLGPTFGKDGLVKVSYGAAGIGNPEDTYALNCQLADTSATQLPVRHVQLDEANPSCYWYTGQEGDYVAGLVDLFELDIMRFVADNAAREVFDFVDQGRKQPDLHTPLTNKKLHACGIMPSVFGASVKLECPPGFAVEGSKCVVCPDDTFKTSTGHAACSRCPEGKVTIGSTAQDHDEESDCQPAANYLLCDQYIGQTNVSGIYPVTINGKQYQVYCDMETDGGGWLLVMNYNRKAGTAPATFTRQLDNGFPILNNTELGIDESRSTGQNGSWGAMDFDVIGALPKVTEFRLYLKTGTGLIHLKSAERNSFEYIRTGHNYFASAGYSYDDYTSPRQGLQLQNMQHEYTPLPGHNQVMLTELVNALSIKALLAFERNSLWVDSVLKDPKFNTHAQLWLRGSGGIQKECPAGSSPVGWGCHLCPEGTYKDVAGVSGCKPCKPAGLLTATGPMRGRVLSAHDSLDDCKQLTPSYTFPNPNGGLLDFYAAPLLTAPDAEAVCVLAGGHLVSVTNAAINNALRHLTEPPYNVKHFWTGYWSGGENPYVPSNYRWLSRAVTDLKFSHFVRVQQLPLVYADLEERDRGLTLYVTYAEWPKVRVREGNFMAFLPGSLLPFVCERMT